MTTVTRFDFGFPSNVTEEIMFEDIEDIKKRDYTNKGVHLKVTLTHELKKNFNVEEFKEEIKKLTHAESIKVDFFYNDSTTERSSEIAQAQSSAEKFIKFCELHEIEYKPSTFALLDEIQNEMFINNFVPNDSFELEYISLRGNVGIWEGQHKEELSVDFTSFNDGIALLTGENGSGKTSFLEMLNPYNTHLTRGGGLKDFFVLKDSHKILIYRSSTGRRYKISMFVDGKAKNVMTSYKIEIKEPDSNVWTDGPEMQSADVYKKWVESVFGPKDLFMRTAFFTTKQIKNIPDLSVASKTEKMELFSTLAGTDYLSVISNQAKKRIGDEEKVIEDIKGQLKDFDNIETRLSDIEISLKEDNKKLKEYKELVEDDTKQLAEFTEKQKDYLTAAGAFDIIRNMLSEKMATYDDNNREIVGLNNNIEALEDELKDIDIYKEQKAWLEENMKKRKGLEVEKSKLDDERLSKTAEIDSIESNNREYQKLINESDKVIYKLDIDIEALQSSIPDVNGTCPVCGAPLSQHKKEELEAEQIKIKADILKKQELIDSEKNTIKSLSEKLVDLTEKRAYVKSLSDNLREVSNAIIQIDEYASNIDIDKINDLLNNSSKKLESLNEKVESIMNTQNKLEDEISELEEKMNTIPVDYSDKIARLNRGIQDSQQQIANLTADISSLEREKKTLSSHDTLVKEIKAKVKEHKAVIHDLTLIMNAFGNNGIQTNELDSAAPEISDITNAILRDTYGPRFTVKFETEREAKSTKKTINDFVIKVFDSRSGSWKVLEDLSQGEGLWVKQALYYAFSVIRTRRTGFCFKTRFLDESDGPLDSPETKMIYLKMIEKAHELSNASKTILITHSTEIKNMIQQGIHF